MGHNSGRSIRPSVRVLRSQLSPGEGNGDGGGGGEIELMIGINFLPSCFYVNTEKSSFYIYAWKTVSIEQVSLIKFSQRTFLCS